MTRSPREVAEARSAPRDEGCVEDHPVRLRREDQRDSVATERFAEVIADRLHQRGVIRVELDDVIPPDAPNGVGH
jgi:hypothetical protein